MKSGAIIIFCLMTGLITNCWSAETMKQFRVSDYGAKGDGKIDDGPAIQKAFDAAKKSEGKTTVVFEKKRYFRK